MVFSEFGRRLEESDSAGTDHGSGGPIMLSGSAVKGGLAGEHPGVNVNQDGDLVVKTDFRTVYQSLIAEWLGGDPNRSCRAARSPASTASTAARR